jgi:CubicO group peptidase (beta-lactamase class C family)
MERWQGAALDYLPRWIEHQMRLGGQPGVTIAAAFKGRLVLDVALGKADAVRGTDLTPRHRFRVASHSKTFTAAGIMTLRERGRLSLDDAAGKYVSGLHPAVAKATISQLLSHTAGLIRDGGDSGQWQDRRPFADETQLRRDLATAPAIEANTRFKYSNHGFGLLGLIIEALTGERYKRWIAKTILAPAGLEHTYPDMPLPRGVPIARGHTGRLPVTPRLVIPGLNPTNALAPATGFISTAGDLARFFSSLDPGASRSLLSKASRREMTRPQWRNPNSAIERYYGLGTMSGTTADWDWFGHAGGFQGFLTRTAHLPEIGLTLSILTNGADGPSWPWLDGAFHILRKFHQTGAPSGRARNWTGRWWTLWGATDLVPMGNKVIVADPSLGNPFMDCGEITVARAGEGRITLVQGYASYGEKAKRQPATGRAREIWLGGVKLVPEAPLADEMKARYAPSSGRRR